MNTTVKEVKGQRIGGRITEELSAYLRRWTNGAERSDVAESVGLSGETIYSIVKRQRNVTETSYPALVALVNIALKNCKIAGEQAKADEGGIKELVA